MTTERAITPDASLRPKFWTLPLEDLSKPEWEALCDGCGRCCLLKLEDEDTGDIVFTSVACRLFDAETCTCGQYALRKQMVAGCVVLSPENIARNAYWMPATCAYRLRFEERPLYPWHRLISGRADSVHAAGISMRHKVLAEYEVDTDDLEDYLIEDMN
ncbi:MAG: YcgN family cysteine cluster protein [Rhodobacteraceae bacterium]|nr:YcgN family cysteine cluster protein [Paracoccaceae bacterium]